MAARSALGFLIAATAVIGLAGCGGKQPSCNAASGCALVIVDGRTGALERVVYPAWAGDATVLGADGSKGWFILSWSRGNDAVQVVHLRADGSIARAWTLPHRTRGPALLTKRRLYVATTVPVVIRGVEGRTTTVASFDATTGKRLWTSPTIPSGRLNGGITALAAGATTVFAAGSLGALDPSHGYERTSTVVALDAQDGHRRAWRMPAMPPYGSVEAMTLAGPRLYVGGAFVRIGSVTRVAVAALRARDGSLESWAPGSPHFSGDDVGAIATVGHTVLVGGTFGLEAYDAVTGRGEAWPAKLGGSAGVFGVSGSTVYLGGNLRSGFGACKSNPCVDTSKGENNLAAVDVSTGRFLTWAPNLARFVSVSSMAVSGGHVLIAGSFVPSIG